MGLKDWKLSNSLKYWCLISWNSFCFFIADPNVFVKVVSAYIYKDYDGDGKIDPYVKVTLGN